MHNKFSKAFTLVELLVSISIVTLLLSTVLYSYSTFNDKIALSSAGQEMAIAIRQAQTYGLNVKEVTSGGGNFTSAYGIYFNPIGHPGEYYIFADTNADQKYSSSGSCNGECIEKFSLRNGVTISSITTVGGCPAARTMQVTFLRPNPDAYVNLLNNGGNPVCSPALNGQIVLTSPKGKTLTVTIESTGQISVQ